MTWSDWHLDRFLNHNVWRNCSILTFLLFIAGTTCIALFLQLRRHQRDLGVVAFALKRFTRNNSELLIFVNFFHQKLVKCLNFSLCSEFWKILRHCVINYIIRIKRWKRQYKSIMLFIFAFTCYRVYKH